MYAAERSIFVDIIAQPAECVTPLSMGSPLTPSNQTVASESQKVCWIELLGISQVFQRVWLHAYTQA